VLKDIFESQGQMEEMVNRLLLEEGFTLMKNFKIESPLIIQGQSTFLQTLKDSQVQGRTAAIMKLMNQPSPDLARDISTIIVDFLTTPGETAAARLTTVLSKSVYDEFFRLVFSGTAGISAAGAGPLNKIPEAALDLLDRGKSQADKLLVRGNQ